jgi:hypothetical protein
MGTAGVWLLVSCGGESVSIDDIDEAKRLADLDSAEVAAVCEYIMSVGDQLLPPMGSEVSCREGTLTFQWGVDCMFDEHVPESCTATVGDMRACFPLLLGAIGDDPCRVADFDSTEDLSDFLAGFPGCDWIEGCTYEFPEPTSATR